MKWIVFVVLVLVIVGFVIIVSVECFEKMKLEYYKFDYQYKNWCIIENLVCDQYSGLDWKGCWRYVNWFFVKKCWEYWYEFRYKLGSVRQKFMK